MIVTTLLVGTVAGAVYTVVLLPLLLLMVPKVAFPPATPPACQVTRVLLRFVMVAVQLDIPLTVTDKGEHESVIVGVVVVVVVEPPPQESMARSTGRRAKNRK